ncbi:MAG: RNA pseudouridine synthase [Clostridia bacterium]|nr:RNA pseudouridine synthase [Clostridia bacterium]MBR2433548.1 RNA pseudouridine synthase [Clostridia bacterium]
MEVIYDDNQIVVIIKPQNMPTQADASGDEDALSAVKQFVKEKYQKPGEAFIGLVHRLDRPTGGVLVFARNSKAASRLSAQMQNNEVEKTYFAVVKGKPKKPKARLENWLKKDPVSNKVTICGMAETDARFAALEYEVIETKNDLSLLKIHLETGRSHQIRVQLAGIGNPIYGDAKYGAPDVPNASTKNLALWAAGLEFRHPTQDQVMVFKVSPPEENYPFSLFDYKNIKF